MIWKDVRLHYLNLKSDRQLNLVLEEAAREMWVPAVDFLNAENNAKSRVDSNSKITIMRTGDKEPDNVEMSREGECKRVEFIFCSKCMVEIVMIKNLG